MRIRNVIAMLLALCLVAVMLPALVLPASAQSVEPQTGTTLEEKLAPYVEYRDLMLEIIENTEIHTEVVIEKQYGGSHGREWLALRNAPEGDYIALAVEMVEAVMEELTDYYTGKTDAMPLTVVTDDIYMRVPLDEAFAITGDPVRAEQSRKAVNELCTAAIEDAREAIRTGDPETAQRALAEYAQALEEGSVYLKSSGLERSLDPLDPLDLDKDCLAGYLAYYRDPTLYWDYDEGELSNASGALFEAFFATTLNAYYQILEDYIEYLSARPSPTAEETELLERLNLYSLQSLTEAETVIFEELLPFFFMWQPSSGTDTAAVSFPGGTWRIEGTPYEIRTGKYFELLSRISPYEEIAGTLFDLETALDHPDDEILAFVMYVYDYFKDLIWDLNEAAGAVANYYGGTSDSLEFTIQHPEGKLMHLAASFGDPSGATRDTDVIIADLYAARSDVQMAISEKKFKVMERSLLEYADAMDRLSKYFISGGLILSYTQMPDLESAFSDPGALQGLDEAGINEAAHMLCGFLDEFVWLNDYFRASDLRDYLITLEELTPEQDEEFRAAQRCTFRFIPEFAEPVLKDGLPEFLEPFVAPGNERAAVIYLPNGAESDAAVRFIRRDADAQLLPNGFTRDGYVFDGWNTKADGTGDASFEDEDDVKITTDLVLYAQWDPLPATAPTLTGQPQGASLTYGYADAPTLTVTATPAEGHTLSAYQWYAGTPGDSESTAIEGAVTASYTIPADLAAGNYSYYCVVTATRSDNLQTQDATSDAATVTVARTTPDWTAPEGLEATYGQTLADVTLPDGWIWDDPLTTPVGNAGSNPFAATFTPEDTDNYDTVPQTLTVDVAKAAIQPAALPEQAQPGVVPTLVEEAGGAPLIAVPVQLPEGYVGIRYSTDGGESWSENVPLGQAGGEYTVIVRYLGDGNHEDLTFDPVTVTVVPAVYAFASDTDARLYFTRETGTGLTVVVRQDGAADTSFAHFSGVYIGDVELVRDVDYTVTEGSTVVTILPSALNELTKGKYTLTILFTNGSVLTVLTVYPSPDEFLAAPVTGDDARPELWICLGAASLILALATVWHGRAKRDRAEK